ncbi:GNAT family N-acetyltransferase [Gracilibacillus caseinilyticus]|uniref:GNAT family N-acetyltransferase n=1 Tax=Gracilibacillus caseinilyticus TaxID=2932256 RepID=A0ABY4F0A0_9BACI|nr:GNAT family protein [Gracilibacillus caseinilyticus]UOQ50094.1 GNAT family N-acetyltransferase [Gracilibacillus caseinilyticus]
MTIINRNKVFLQEATDSDIAELYYWKFEEKEQAAKKWNGPYIKEERVSKEEYKQGWRQEIIEGIPSSLVIKTVDKVIGYVGSYWVDKNTNWLETGIVIYDSNYWNGGYGSEAYKQWMDYLFASTAIHRLGMSTWSGNSRMIRVAEKLGMKEEARVREARVVNGEYFDAIKMGILRREWEGLK